MRALMRILSISLLLAVGAERAPRLRGPSAPLPVRAQPTDLIAGAIGGVSTDVAATDAHAIVGHGVRVSRLQLGDDSITLVASSRPLDGLVERVAIAGNLGLGLTRASLWIFDLSGADGVPTVVGRMQLGPGSQPQGLRVLGDRAWLALGAGHAVLVDFSQPSEPRLVERIHTIGEALSVDARDDLVAITTAVACGLRATDPPGRLLLIDPRLSPPAIIGELTIGRCARGAALDGTRLWLLDEQLGLAKIDITDPTMPRLIGHSAYAAEPSGFRLPTWITMHRGCPLIVFPHGEVERICESDQPGRRGILGEPSGPVSGAVVRNDVLVLSGRGVGVRYEPLLEPAPRGTPTIIWEPMALAGLRVAFVGGEAWVSAASPGPSYYPHTRSQNGVWRIDLQEMAEPRLAVAEPILGNQHFDELEVLGDRAYAYPDEWRVRILDTSDGSTLGFVESTSFPVRLMPTQPALLTLTLGSMEVYDVRDPSNALPLDPIFLDRPGRPPVFGADSRGTHLFAYDAVGIVEIDLADPTKPDVQREFGTGVRGIAVNDHHLFVLDAAGLHVLDSAVGNPPNELGFIDLETTTATQRRMKASNDTVVLLDNGAAQAFDLRNPSHPTELLRTPQLVLRDVALRGDWLVATGDSVGVLTICLRPGCTQPSGTPPASEHSIVLPWLLR